MDRRTPGVVPVPNPGVRLDTVAAGVFHSFAGVSNGTVWGWGSNGAGQLGVGAVHPQSSAVPLRVNALQQPTLSGGYAHTVAR